MKPVTVRRFHNPKAFSKVSGLRQNTWGVVTCSADLPTTESRSWIVGGSNDGTKETPLASCSFNWDHVWCLGPLPDVTSAVASRPANFETVVDCALAVMAKSTSSDMHG